LNKTAKTVYLHLEDGSILEGKSFGSYSDSDGEVVFNTGMMGYPESFTDPSYTGQILVLTYPLIGNYGVPEHKKDKDGLPINFEGNKISIKGVVVTEHSENYNHWNAETSLDEWLNENNIPGITDIDTRALTQKLRESGTMLGRISTSKTKPKSFYDPNAVNLMSEASIDKPVLYKRGDKHVVVVDTGVKLNIIRNFLDRNISVWRVPWNYDFFGDEAIKIDGIFFSNGPGDPAILKETQELARRAFETKKPTFGICLGSQVMAIAAGAKTYKLKYGHRAQNQPCIDEETGRCYITSQNHGFAVDTKTLQKDWKPLLTNANDCSNEGIKHRSLPFFAVQFHPEATPGPSDCNFYFDKFLALL